LEEVAWIRRKVKVTESQKSTCYIVENIFTLVCTRENSTIGWSKKIENQTANSFLYLSKIDQGKLKLAKKKFAETFFRTQWRRLPRGDFSPLTHFYLSKEVLMIAAKMKKCRERF
jgi:hypothetical protein